MRKAGDAPKGKVGGARKGAGRPREIDRKVKFLAAFAVTGNVSKSCRLVGCDRKAVRLWLEDPQFREKYEEAKEEAVDYLEDEMRRRAVEGVPRLKFNPKTGSPYQVLNAEGVLVDYVEHEYSDALLLRLAEAHAPLRFSPRQKIDLGKLDDETVLRLLAEVTGGGS